MYAWLMNLPRPVKRTIHMVVDTALIPACLYLAYWLRDGQFIDYYIDRSWQLFPLLTVLGFGVLMFWRLDSYRLHTFEARASIRFGLCAASLAMLAMGISYLLDLESPRSVPLIFGGLYFIATTATRVLGMVGLDWLGSRTQRRTKVAVYGAGSAGIQLVSALRNSREVQPVAFVDDNPALRGMNIAGLPVRGPETLKKLAERGKIQRILIAIPSVRPARRNALIKSLSELPVEVQVLPSFIELMDGRKIEDTLRTVTPDELLGRDSVDLDSPEVAKAYAGRTVMVTGAGGSIGSELCRQLLSCAPARIVLFENSEYALYAADRELAPMAAEAGVTLHARLGSVTDAARVAQVIEGDAVEIVLHAAAYKHVPLIEGNEVEGARNNVLGTHVVAEAARAAGIERFILVSTDKAVRPTNIMGGTKRLAELVVQDLQTRAERTKFAMVRFGNVLGSSGSVLPLFQRQIAAGGPVTVTHPEVTRYFMTIPEATRLVLLAGAYAEGGDLFVLDMGEPRRIIDIARRMITLAGRTVREPGSEEGDIAIEVIGLRPGEKLYEELLIGEGNLLQTPHPKILRAEEGGLSEIEIAAMLREIRSGTADCDAARIRTAVEKWVEGYRPAAAAVGAETDR